MVGYPASHIVVTVGPSGEKSCNNFRPARHHMSQPTAVDTAVDNLRANHGMNDKIIHTMSFVHTRRPVRPPVSTADSHSDTPGVLGKHPFIPSFHSA